MGYDFELTNETSLVHPVHNQAGDTLAINGQSIRAALTPGLATGEYFLDIDGERERVFIATRADTHYIHWRGRAYRVDAINALERARRAAEPNSGAEILSAPMPGTVVEVVALEGSTVETGALLLTIESMKLQTAITAPHPARVAEVYVLAGATFDQGDPFIRLEEIDDDVLEATPATQNGEDSP
jgi:biotin carboxyl carrier protein